MGNGKRYRSLRELHLRAGVGKADVDLPELTGGPPRELCPVCRARHILYCVGDKLHVVQHQAGGRTCAGSHAEI